MKLTGAIIMLLACIMAWQVNGGYACASLLWIGFLIFMIGEKRNESI